MKKYIIGALSGVLTAVVLLFVVESTLAAKSAVLTAAQNWNDTQWRSACVNNKNPAGKYIWVIEMCPANGVSGVVEQCKSAFEETTTLSQASGFVNHLIQYWNIVYPGYEP